MYFVDDNCSIKTNIDLTRNMNVMNFYTSVVSVHYRVVLPSSGKSHCSFFNTKIKLILINTTDIEDTKIINNNQTCIMLQ